MFEDFDDFVGVAVDEKVVFADAVFASEAGGVGFGGILFGGWSGVGSVVGGFRAKEEEAGENEAENGECGDDGDDEIFWFHVAS